MGLITRINPYYIIKKHFYTFTKKPEANDSEPPLDYFEIAGVLLISAISSMAITGLSIKSYIIFSGLDSDHLKKLLESIVQGATIFAGFQLNAMVFMGQKRLEQKKITPQKRDLFHEAFHNLAFSLMCTIVVVILGLLAQNYINILPISAFTLFLVFLSVHSLWVMLKRIHAVIEDEYL